MSAVWLRVSYYVLASEVWIGDFTPWGEVIAAQASASSFGDTVLTIRGGDDEAAYRYGQSQRIPLIRMHDPIERGAPSWTVPAPFAPSGVPR